ncbi:DoxX family protein [Chitinophaga defluvii]|uniref:DoxX family protein n=1 Tax=Chitinophaga defluvii TaxID=3163343 RepID=A0ABV2SYM1_9BACT
MILKIINSLLILVAVFMGFKQGYAMFSGKPEMMDMFSKWGFTKTGLMALGATTMLSAALILFPKTFVWGNFLMAAGILLIICFHLQDKDLKGMAIELPFLLMNLVIIYLQHPLKTN